MRVMSKEGMDIIFVLINSTLDVFFISQSKMNTKTTSTKSFSPRPKPLTIQPKKILIKGKERKIFESLDIPLPKKDNQKDTSTDKVN